MDPLTIEILKFYDDCKETEESKERRTELRRRINDIVNEFIANADAVVVGSCVNGFGTKNGDLDLTILIPFSIFTNYSATHILIKIQQSFARDRSSYTDIEVVSTANVPIITFIYRCVAERIPCDISINKRNNVFNAVLLKAYSQLDVRLQPLMLALKKWAKGRRVIDSRNNRLASFTLSLMVIHYLQSGCYPPVLPSLQQTHPRFFSTSASNVDAISSYINDPLPQRIISFSSTNNQSIGELFIGFFNHYCCFNWGRDGISVRAGKNIPRPLKRGSNNTCLYVEDPCEVNSNTARGVFKEWPWNDIVLEFAHTRQKLQNGRSFKDII